MCNSCTRLTTVNTGYLKEVRLGAFGKCPNLIEVSGLDWAALDFVKRGWAWSR